VPDRLAAVLPALLAAQRRQRRIRADFERTTVPPAPQAWKSFGRSYVVPPARVSRPDCITVGDGVVILENVWMSVVRAFDDVEPRLSIGDRVRIGRGCQFSVVGEVVVEDDVLIGDFVQIGDTSHDYREPLRGPALVRPRPTRIAAGALIAGQATVLPGVTVGAGAVVDHHSVVTSDVPPGAVVAGNPAQVIRS
jgi:acetyltransferase-like isoleucine patch superfamily enzyme